MDIFRGVQARRERWEAARRESIQQAREQWVGRVVSFSAPGIEAMYPWLPDEHGLIYGQVVGIDDYGQVSLVYGGFSDGKPFTRSFPFSCLGAEYRSVEP